jgi:hypothetical protein
MAQTPESEVVQALKSGVGFYPGERSLPMVVKHQLTKYFEEKRKIALIRDDQQFKAHYDRFKSMGLDNLNLIWDELKKIEDESQKFSAALDEYVNRVKLFSEDYAKAKLQGFFVSNIQHQSLMANRLYRKIFHLERLNEEVKTLTAKLMHASDRHSQIVLAEKDALENDNSVDLEDVMFFFQETHKVSYPNLGAQDYKAKVETILNINIAPLP